jgi:ribosomal 30S subunit maturation factor RimM
MQKIDYSKIDWQDYDTRVMILVSEGMDHSDAEAVVDAEILAQQRQEQTVQDNDYFD